MHIYAFGSLCRGEMSAGSDVDLLAIVEGHDDRFDPDTFSIYSYGRIKQLWLEGSPFAWHLSLESRLIFSSEPNDFIVELKTPSKYKQCLKDCEKFLDVFLRSAEALSHERSGAAFELSNIFLSIRNFATCYSLGVRGTPLFSRDSALRLGTESIPITRDIYRILERSRILCTRGLGEKIGLEEVEEAIPELGRINNWMKSLIHEARQHDRIQQQD
jgi:hypothetical protein